MITDTYHVFGSGSSVIFWFGDAEAILRYCAETKREWRDDGHNGFVGTMSGPDREGVDSQLVCWPPAEDGYRPDGGRTIQNVQAEYLASKFHDGIARAVAFSWAGIDCEKCLSITKEDILKMVSESWLLTNSVAELVMKGEIGSEWLPEGATAGAGGMWLRPTLEAAYAKGVNPLPIVRKIFPRPIWAFSRQEVKRSCEGMYPTYGDGDIIASWAVKGGWVYAQAPLGSAQDNSWF